MKKQSLIAFNAGWSAAVFDQHGAMTVTDFIEYASEYMFGEGCEGLYENISQCASEIAQFGDSGPGTMLRLGEHIAEFNKIADRFTALTGTDVSRPRLPYVPHSSDYDFEYPRY